MGPVCIRDKFLECLEVTSPRERRFTTAIHSVRPCGLATLQADPPTQPPGTSTRSGKELSGRSDRKNYVRIMYGILIDLLLATPPGISSEVLATLAYALPTGEVEFV